MSPHDSLAVHPDRSERSSTLPSSSGLCVRQIENEQQSIAGEVSQLLKVMALASRLAGPDNAVPSLPGSDSWLSEKKQQQKRTIRSLFLHVLVQSSYILDVVGTFRMLGSSAVTRLVTRLWLCLTVSPARPVRSSHDLYATSQRHDLWQWCNGKAIEPLAGRRPTARWGCLRKLVFVRLPLLP